MHNLFISHHSNNHMQLCEMISTYNQHWSQLAIDNDPASCATTGVDSRPWLFVKLNSLTYISGLLIYGKLAHFLFGHIFKGLHWS